MGAVRNYVQCRMFRADSLPQDREKRSLPCFRASSSRAFFSAAKRTLVHFTALVSPGEADASTTGPGLIHFRFASEIIKAGITKWAPAPAELATTCGDCFSPTFARGVNVQVLSALPLSMLKETGSDLTVSCSLPRARFHASKDRRCEGRVLTGRGGQARKGAP